MTASLRLNGTLALRDLLVLPLTLCVALVGCASRDTSPSAAGGPLRDGMHQRTFELGHSVNGTPLEMKIFGDGPDAMLIFGGIHGDEPTSTAVALALVSHLRENPALCSGRTIAVLPVANPDGLDAGTRGNAHGVDLNRNFPAGNWKKRGKRNGAAPASEPETQALMRALLVVQPRRIVSIHSIDRGKHCNNYDGPAAKLASHMAKHNGYDVKPTMGYPTPGSFGSWAGIERGIPTITLELPADASGAQAWAQNREALLAFITSGGDVE
jgi:predicted deacylase